MTSHEETIIDQFHRLYYKGPDGESPLFGRTFWMNVPCLKCPLDLWTYQEIIAEIQPDLIVETGTYKGGSALFMAHLLDIIGKGEIITIDISDDPDRPSHPRINFVSGSSTDVNLIDSLLQGRPDETRMVVLDSDHSKDHVLQELNLLAPYVNLNGYIIVEDTNLNGHPAYPDFGEGPYEAVEEFLATNQNFRVDESREKFLMTFNPRGFLKRVR